MVVRSNGVSAVGVRRESRNNVCSFCACSHHRLKHFEQTPPVLQFNKHIRSGYRCGYSYFEALFSTLELHNESGNIWSHLLPALILFWTLWSPHWSVFPDDRRWIEVVSVATSLLCLLASVGYHTFMACDHHYHHWIRVDVCGIYGLLLGSQVDVFRLGFPCHRSLVSLFIGVYSVVGLLGVSYSLKAKTPMTRGLPLLGLMVIRIGVLITRLLFGSANMEAWWLYLCAEMLSLLGGIINASRFPECIFRPMIKKLNDNTLLELGLFDYWFNSHQIMHVLVAIGIFCMRYGLASDCYYLTNHQQCEEVLIHPR